MATTTPTLSLGRIVRYIAPHGTECPALVIAVTAPETCALRVFTDTADLRALDVHYDADGRPGTWHWPPREGA